MVQLQGLRIYNWHCGRASAGVDNLPSILTSATEATTRKSFTSIDDIYLTNDHHHCIKTINSLQSTQPGNHDSASPKVSLTDFCRNIDNLAAFAREKCFKLTAAFEKLTYTDAGTNAPSKDVDQVCLARNDDADD